MTKTKHDADAAFIQVLATLLCANDLTELEVERTYGDNDALSVRITRKLQAAPAVQSAVAEPAAPGTPVPAPAAPTPIGTPEDPAAAPGAVTSPMVGTIYMQPEPGAPAFVSVGATVSEGDTLLIVEAMKTMNHIPAPQSGMIERILVEDGAAVEYGTPLVIIA
ncbi:MAG: acetyl-CoA carboxylase, biotin carboxyl carrier protein [Rhodobacteraceae bacterium]|nr:acetyl-CoA carboxylase, biotin carboxyl carrier protein [Paracoccaceae bacterium]